MKKTIVTGLFYRINSSYLGTATKAYVKFKQVWRNVLNHFEPGAGHLQFSTPFMYNVNILWTKKGNIRKYTAFCGGINEDDERKSKKIIK